MPEVIFCRIFRQSGEHCHGRWGHPAIEGKADAILPDIPTLCEDVGQKKPLPFLDVLGLDRGGEGGECARLKCPGKPLDHEGSARRDSTLHRALNCPGRRRRYLWRLIVPESWMATQSTLLSPTRLDAVQACLKLGSGAFPCHMELQTRLLYKCASSKMMDATWIARPLSLTTPGQPTCWIPDIAL